MGYDFVLIDKIFCESYINWTYEENDETPGRTGVFEIHLKSAMKKIKDKKCLLIMTSNTREELEKQYSGQDRNMNHLSSIIEASEEIKILFCFEETDSVMKSANLLKWKKINFCILTGNSLIYDLAKKDDIDVFYLKDSKDVLKKITI